MEAVARILARGLELVGEPRGYAKLLSTPDIEVFFRLYSLVEGKTVGAPARIVGYHQYGERKCLVVGVFEDENKVYEKALMASLLLALLKTNRCCSWLYIPRGFEKSLSRLLEIARSLGEVVLVAPDPSLKLFLEAKYSETASVEEEALYNCSGEALKIFFEEAGIEPKTISIYEPRRGDVLLTLEVAAKSLADTSIAYVVENGKAYRLLEEIHVEELLENSREGYEITEFSVERVKPEAIEADISILPSEEASLNALKKTTYTVTPPWSWPLSHAGNISWLVYGAGWAGRLLEEAKQNTSVEEAIVEIADLWKYQLREKKASPSDAALAISISRLLAVARSLLALR